MPIYDFKCITCDEVKNDEFVKSMHSKVKCPVCKTNMQQQFPLTNAYCFPADGLTLEHVGPQPKTFRSKKEMVRFARENKMELGALL